MWPITRTCPARPAEPRRCRIRLPRSGAGRRPEGEPDDSPESSLADRPILCAVCRAGITHQRHAMAVNGRHQHAFFNPAGIAFEIRCFHMAPGTVFQGDPSAEFTWFAGYRWRVVLCASCHTHLGWIFTGEGLFYGLIAHQLLETQ